MTKRAGKRKWRMGPGPLKPPPGPNGPIKRDPMKSLTDDSLPPETSLAIELRALTNNWLLTADTKLRQQLIVTLLNKATVLSRKEHLTDTEFNRLMRIFQTLSLTEQRQQRLAIDKLRLMQGGNSELPSQVNNQQININVEGGLEVTQIPNWQAVRQLLADSTIQETLAGPRIDHSKVIDAPEKNVRKEANKQPAPIEAPSKPVQDLPLFDGQTETGWQP